MAHLKTLPMLSINSMSLNRKTSLAEIVWREA